MRLTALCLLFLLTACGTEVEVPSDAAGSGDTTADTAVDTAVDATADTTADTAADTTAGDTGSDTGAVCPAEPFSTEACDQEGASCNYGTECCCGTCYPSTFCNCSRGQWACGSSDACMRPSCEGSTCTTDTDCIGGAPSQPLTCIAGLCTAPPAQGGCYGLAAADCESHNAEACVFTMVVPAEYPDQCDQPSSCYPAAACTSDADCPSNRTCMEVGFGCGGGPRNMCIQTGG